MPLRDQFFEDMAGENRQAALLVAQVGGAPNELQLITQVAELDEDAGGLRPIRTYLIRVLGALEHRVSDLGMTVGEATLTTDHPLLYEYTTRPTAVFFRGTPDNVDSLTLDIAQAHATTFEGWRHFPQYLNVAQPLATLLGSGGGLLGQMPEPLAKRLLPVLEHHGLEHKTTQDKAYIDVHDNPGLLESTLSALVIGDSYFISYAFSFDEMRGRTSKG